MIPTALDAAHGLSEPSGASVPLAREDLEQSIASRFEQLAKLHPNRLAVKTAQHAWTYEQLNRAGNRIAHAILARQGSQTTPAVVLIEQSAPLVAAQLGVIKAGKLLVVLDPSHPPSRLAQFVEEAQPSAIVTDAEHLELATALAGGVRTVIDVDRLGQHPSDNNPDIPSAADDPAVIFFSSGSTGRPKGVLGTHRNWIHCARVYGDRFHVCSEDRITLLALGTSQAVKNLCLALLNGAAVFPYDVRRGGLDGLAAWMRQEEITITVMGASLFRSFVDVLDGPESLPRLRLIRIGSEPVHKRDVELYKKHFSPACLLVNGLASGETQTIRFFCIDHATEFAGNVAPVGYPVDDKTVLLLDEAGKEVETGQEGEIVVESQYLASGYWRRPDLTDAVFRPAEKSAKARRYYSGDLGRMDADGCLVCLGRKNSRVKIRGYGVDLLEIELALRNFGGVKESVVTAQPNRSGYAYLIAYIVPAVFPGPSNAMLREGLAKTLPDYMIPSTFVVLSALPRTSSGKVDREVLPRPGRAYRDTARSATQPRTPIEITLAAIWCDVLGIDSIDIHDHFYDLGGESLQALRIMARIRKNFHVDVDLQSLVEFPTVAEMSAVVAGRLAARIPSGDREPLSDGPGESRRAGDRQWSYLVELQSGSGRVPVFFLPGGFGGGRGEFFVYARLARHVGCEYPFYGFMARSAAGREPSQASVEEMARDYLAEMRSVQPDGPYILAGECGGGVVAYEIAQQLQRQGHKVALLVLIDTRRPDGAMELRERIEGHFYVSTLNYHREQLRRLAPMAKVNYLLRKSGMALWQLPRVLANLDSRRRIEDIRTTYHRAIYRYRPQSYAGKMTLLVNEKEHQDSPDLGWKGLAEQGIEIHTLPGDHDSYIRENVQATARKFQECLDAVHGYANDQASR